ncbi:transporter [Mycetocola tolaasinivorans]|uniref:Transporter n=1 Tax=Mycetocola tolaasinivorans TaxID=76635 RepID=A0A3L7ABS1_9MICO|nr:transporter [Mycetocola tolaasinivorans]RLP77936.1 transporter [Mycetocola tolaasinivorans]
MTHERIPLNTFAIAFGLAGLAGTWSVAVKTWHLDPLIGTAFWGVAAIAWVWLLIAHAVRARRSAQPLSAQLAHPAQGPIAALAPILGMLVGARLYAFVPLAGTILVLASIAVGAVFAGWIIARWARGLIDIDLVHGGYLLPTVAAGFLAATASAQIGWPALGWGAFGVGSLFWVLIFTLILARLALRPALPAPLVPTLAIMMAPPAVAGGAWIALTGEHAGIVVDILLGLTLILVLLQVGLIPLYRRTPFSLGAWSYTFPLAAVATFVMSAVSNPMASGVGVVVVSGVVLVVAFYSVRSRRAARVSLVATA